jgi:biofilm PGA synthesis N-glycosyltransferase PgaC
MLKPKLLVVTPAKNESRYLQRTIDSMLGQTFLPVEWIVVDDGSTDGTAEMAERAAERHSWISVIRKPVCAQRRVGLATVDAMKLALEQTRHSDYDFLAVIDADVELPASYFALILAEFARNPSLGIAGGQIYERGPKQNLVPMRGGAGATAGADKCWRRECFEKIGGLVENAAWDGIDQYQAAMHGWSTRSFDDEGMRVLHLRQMGASHKGILHGRMRRGESGYFMGSHPLWMLASAAFHLRDVPYVLASAATLAGYFRAMWRQAPRVDRPELIQFIRRKQISTLISMWRPFISRGGRSAEAISWQQ